MRAPTESLVAKGSALDARAQCSYSARHVATVATTKMSVTCQKNVLYMNSREHFLLFLNSRHPIKKKSGNLHIAIRKKTLKPLWFKGFFLIGCRAARISVLNDTNIGELMQP